MQPVHGLSVQPDALGEPRTKEVVRHAPVGRREERERGHQRSAAWHAGVAAGDRDGLVEAPADVAGHDDRRGTRGRPDGEAVSRPRVEHVAAEDEHGAIDGDVVARMHITAHAQMVGVRQVAVLGVEISELGIDVELQQERHLGVWRRFPDDHSILVAIVGRRGRGAGCRLCGRTCRLCQGRCRHRGICRCR